MPAILRFDPWDIDRRLAELDLTRAVLIDVVEACVAGLGGCTENDPPNAPGYESYRHGTRRARELLRGDGWAKDDSGNFCSVVNHKRRFRLVVMNSDDGAGLPDRVPQNRCKKGPNSERAATVNQASLFAPEDMPLPSPEAQPSGLHGYKTWHLCVFISGETVRAELSLLNEFQGGYFTGLFEKIIVLGDGDWKPANVFDDPDQDDGAPEFAVEVKRK